MTTLHILRTSAFSSTDLTDCIDMLNELDDLVLIDDGCYNVNHADIEMAQAALKHPIKIINEHVTARGLHVDNSYLTITLSDLVELTFTHQNSVTWQ